MCATDMITPQKLCCMEKIQKMHAELPYHAEHSNNHITTQTRNLLRKYISIGEMNEY